MTTHTLPSDSPVATLQRPLLANAAFCASGGLFFIVASGWLAGQLGLANPSILVGLGAALIAYAAFLYFYAQPGRISRGLVLLAAVLDGAWVIGSVALIVGGWLDMTTLGAWIVGVIAATVDVFGVVELVAWWRTR